MTITTLPRRYGPKAPPKIKRRKAFRQAAIAPIVDLTKHRTTVRRTENPLSFAYSLHQAATKLDEDPETIPRAMALYEQALALDPRLSVAWTNLGNCHFRTFNPELAEQYYRTAIALDPGQCEALYNLGYLMLERRLTAEAILLLERATEADPKFPDAHFNLAMAYEQASPHTCHEWYQAQIHWRLYLNLEPKGMWSEIARRHLDDEFDGTEPKRRLSLVK